MGSPAQLVRRLSALPSNGALRSLQGLDGARLACAPNRTGRESGLKAIVPGRLTAARRRVNAVAAQSATYYNT